jgi:phage recombination protein Bet
MNDKLATTQKTSLAVQTANELNLSQSYLNLVTNTFAKGATDNELSLFLRTANRLGLDVTARQIFMVKRWDSTLNAMAMSIQTSIDGFRLIADRTGKYAPSKEPSFTHDKDGNLESATAYIKKFVANEWHEVAATAFYDEYLQKTKDGKPNMIWGKMPRLMLAKCAESLVLRRAFPADLSGLYTSDEMGTAEIPTITQPETIQPITPVVEKQVESKPKQIAESKPAKPEEVEATAISDERIENEQIAETLLSNLCGDDETERQKFLKNRVIAKLTDANLLKLIDELQTI